MCSSDLLREELGVRADLRNLYRFEYHARFGDTGSEHELCSVFIGLLAPAQTVKPNPTEIAEWGWFACQDVDARIAQNPAEFTPWFLLEWARLRGEFSPAVDALLAQADCAPRASVA